MFTRIVFLLISATAFAQPKILISHTTESLRGVSAVSRQVAWASGTHGTYLRTTDGTHWVAAKVPGAESLDFRGVVAFSADDAFLMSSGPGDQSRIYHTSDGGQHWQAQFTNSNPKGFFDSIVFWDAKHGLVLGDPIADESGKLKFELLATEDGQTWHALSSANLPSAAPGEGAFAASNSCVATRDSNIWFATGGSAARVFHSPDRGETWQVIDTPIVHGKDSQGIFSVAFRDALHGVIAGGDYKHPDYDGPNLAFTNDGGKTWTLSDLRPQAYFSAVAYDQGVNGEAMRESQKQAADPDRNDLRKRLLRPIAPERLFIVGQDFVFDFRPPNNPRRISSRNRKQQRFNAVAAFPEGGALAVGPNGTIAVIP